VNSATPEFLFVRPGDYVAIKNEENCEDIELKIKSIDPSALIIELPSNPMLKCVNIKKVSKIDNQNGKYKLPHIGWNQINIVKQSKIFENIENNSHMYFVHSYEFLPNDKNVISATTDYSTNIVCSVEKENIFGTQFHPEKSDMIRLKIIDNFINL